MVSTESYGSWAPAVAEEPDDAHAVAFGDPIGLAHDGASPQTVHVPHARHMGLELGFAGIVRAQQGAQVLEHVGHHVEVGCEQRNVRARVGEHRLVRTELYDVAVDHCRLSSVLPARRHYSARAARRACQSNGGGLMRSSQGLPRGLVATAHPTTQPAAKAANNPLWLPVMRRRSTRDLPALIPRCSGLTVRSFVDDTRAQVRMGVHSGYPTGLPTWFPPLRT